MATNEFVPFAASTGANVVTQGEYVGSAWQQNGFITGVAKSAEANKVWRQATTVAAAWGQVVVNIIGWDALDNGDYGSLATAFQQCIWQIAGQSLGDLANRMNGAEANLNQLWVAINNELNWRNWADPTINSLWSRAAGWDNWLNGIQGWINQWDPVIQSLWNWKNYDFDPAWSNLQNNQLPNLQNGINNLNQQTAQLNQTVSNIPQAANSLPGWCRFPNGFQMCWLMGNQETQAGNSDYTYNLPIWFSSVLSIQVTTIRPYGGGQQQDDIFEYQIISWGNDNVRIWRARRGDDGNITTQPWIQVIGWA